MKRFLFAALMLGATALCHAELTEEQKQIPLEKRPDDPALKMIVLLAGSPSNKPGQHEYFAGCALMRQWLSEVPGVWPVLVSDGWPHDETLIDDAACIVSYMDGGAKMAFLPPERWTRMQRAAARGAGLVVLHQGVDCPAEQASEFMQWFGAVWQPDIGCRGHWDMSFSVHPAHPVQNGVASFDLLKDGWLYNLHFATKGVRPVLSGEVPDTARTTPDAKAQKGRAEVVGWVCERSEGGRSFGFTGCDLHRNWEVESQRKLVLNGILWSAGLAVPSEGVASTVTAEDLAKNLDRKVFQPKPAKKDAKVPQSDLK